MERYPFVDRNPCIIAAGKKFGDPTEQIHPCFTNVQLQDEVEAVQKQYGFVKSKKENDTGAKQSTSSPGVFTEIGDCLMSPMKTPFQCLEDEVRDTVYDSYWNQAVGKCRDATPNLPKGMDIYCTTYGKPTARGISAGELIHPHKIPGQVVYEDKVCHDFYKYSHQNYWPGEQIKRCYQPPFNPFKTYGCTYKADNRGVGVKKCVTWFNDDPITFVSRRQAAVRNRTLPALGKTLDTTGVTEVVHPDTTFGKTTIQGFYGVGDLLNECTPSLVRRDVQSFISAANKMRQAVAKKINRGELELEEIYEEMMSLDSEKKCVLHFDCVVKICNKHRIPMDRNKIEPLLLILGLLKTDGMISYKKFIDFINVNAPFPELKKEHYSIPPEFQSYDEKYQSKQPNSQCKCEGYLKEPAGLPSTRIDKSFPVYAGCRAHTESLGDETTARAVISPSIFTQYGLTHRDFFKPRSKEFLSNLFKKIEVKLSDEDVEELYKEGCSMDNTGGVCIETFRNLLDARAYNAYMKI